MIDSQTRFATEGALPVLSRKRWSRMGLRLAAGLSKARVAQSEGVAEEVVDRLLGDSEFIALQGEFARLMAMGHDERMKILRDRAFFVLHMAIDAGDLRAASFFVTEEGRGRDPVDTLITKFWTRATREARKAAPSPTSETMPATAAQAASRPGPARSAQAIAKRPSVGTPTRLFGSAASRVMPGERFRQRGVEALTQRFQEELIVHAAAGPTPEGRLAATHAPGAQEADRAPVPQLSGSLEPCWIVPTLRQRRSFGIPWLLSLDGPGAAPHRRFDPAFANKVSSRPPARRIMAILPGRIHDGPSDHWRFEPEPGMCHVNAMLGPMLPLGP